MDEQEIDIKDGVEESTLVETPEEKPEVKVEKNEDIVEVPKDEEVKEEKPKRFVRARDDDEVTEEDLTKYSEEVQKRIKRLTWAKKNEQRGREQAERDRDEAVRIAQMLLEEKRKAETERDQTQESHLKSESERIDIAIESANQRLQDAFDAFDAPAVAKANADIARLMVQKERLAEQKPREKVVTDTRQEDKARVDSQQTPPQAQPDPLAQAWAKQNRWFQLDGFGQPSNEESAFALKVHETLLRNGIHPVLNATDYYRKLDATMRANFPEHFGEETPAKPADKPAPRTPVSAVTRAPSGATKVKLTESQAALAKRLGVPLEEYAKQLEALRS